MSHVFHRHCKMHNPIISRGQGVYLIDDKEKNYLDGSGGAAVSCLGHGDKDVINAIKNQLDQVEFAHSGFFTSKPAEDLARTLVEHAPGHLDRVFIVSGGSEAIESSLKLARQYFVECGQPERVHIIARQQSYHGNTLGALASGGNKMRRDFFKPLLINNNHISPCYAYRHQREGESEEAYAKRAAYELEAHILHLGPETVMAFVAETVVGASLGCVPAVKSYFKHIRAICDKYNILLILDEVMCGMGRTGTLFAYEREGIVPDIVAIAKGLGAGYQPIGAMLCSDTIYDKIEKGSGFFQHGHTVLAHPVVCSAALAVLTKILDGDMISRVNAIGDKLYDKLCDNFKDHPHVGDIRGRGLFLGMEIVRDKTDKTPFPREDMLHKRIKQACFEAGLICYPGGGCVDGVLGDHILLAPPFIMEDCHIDELIQKLYIGLEKACHEIT